LNRKVLVITFHKLLNNFFVVAFVGIFNDFKTFIDLL
jgi:hypothetical protein